MTNAELLILLEADLEILTDFMDAEAKAEKEAELTQYLEAAKTYIAREGATLDLTDIGDCRLVVMYAAWLYGKRRESTGAGMPRMLRWNLNNRIFAEKTGDADAAG